MCLSNAYINEIRGLLTRAPARNDRCKATAHAQSLSVGQFSQWGEWQRSRGKSFLHENFNSNRQDFACKLCLFLPKRPNANETINIAKVRLRATAKFSQREKTYWLLVDLVWFFSNVSQAEKEPKKIGKAPREGLLLDSILLNRVAVVDWSSLREADSCFLPFPWFRNRGFSSEVCTSKPQRIKHFERDILKVWNLKVFGPRWKTLSDSTPAK